MFVSDHNDFRGDPLRMSYHFQPNYSANRTRFLVRRRIAGAGLGSSRATGVPDFIVDRQLGHFAKAHPDYFAKVHPAYATGVRAALSGMVKK